MKTAIEMAREAEFPAANYPALVSDGEWEALDRLIALARADERRAMMQLFTDPENQPTQHGTVTLEYMQREIAAEREACAELCVKLAVGGGFAADCAAAIRARGSNI